MLGVEKLLDRYVQQISGGEQQRVAIGRAIVQKPNLYLLDEPISNLDASLRETVRTEVRRLQRQLGATMIMVTHDQMDALAVADRIAVLGEGTLRQIGTPEELYQMRRRHPLRRQLQGGLKGLGDSLIVASMSTLLSLLLGVPAAYALGRFNTGGENLSFTVLSILFMPPVAVAISMYILWASLGLLDSYTALHPAVYRIQPSLHQLGSEELFRGHPPGNGGIGPGEWCHALARILADRRAACAPRRSCGGPARL